MFGIVAIVLGVVFLVIGLPLYKVTMFIYGIVNTITSLMLFSYFLIMPFDVPLWVGWVHILIGAAVGTGIGFLTSKASKIGVFSIGASQSVLFWTLLYLGGLYHFLRYKTMVLGGMAVGLAIFGGLLTIITFPLSFMSGTSFVGAYMICRGVNSVIGGFVNEYTLAIELEEGRFSNVGWTTYVYLLSWIILAVIGMLIQKVMTDFHVFEKKANGN